MPSRFALAVVLLAPVLAPNLLAQGPWTAGGDRSLSFPAHAKGSGGSFGSVGATDLTGNLHPDVVFRYGDRAYVQHDPFSRERAHEIPHDLVDFAVVPGAAAGTPGFVVSASSAGIDRWDFDAPSASFVPTKLTQDELWEECVGVYLGHLDAGSELDLIGVHEDRERLLIRSDILSSSGQVTRVVDIDGLFLDLCLLDWSGDDRKELVLVSDAAFEVFSGDGSSLYHVQALAKDAIVRPLRQNGYARERAVVLMTAHQGTQQSLVVADPFLVEVMPLGALEFHDLATGDLDNDGLDTDLVLGSNLTHSMLALYNRSNGSPPSAQQPTFSWQLSGLIDLLSEDAITTPAPLQGGKLLITDLDSDSDADLFLGVDQRAELVMFRNTDIDHSEYHVAWGAPSWSWSGTTLDGVFGLTLDPGTRPMNGSSHVEVTLWRADADANAVFETQSQPWSTPEPSLHATGTGPWSVDISYLLPEPSYTTTAHMWLLEVRQVEADLTGLEILRAGPSMWLAFGTSKQTNEAFLDLYEPLVLPSIVFEGLSDGVVLFNGPGKIEEPNVINIPDVPRDDDDEL